MNKSHGYVTALGRRTEAAAGATMDAVQSGLVETSPAIAAALRDELERRLSGTVAGSTVSTRAVGPEPPAASAADGADLLLSFHTHFSDVRAGTGLLVAITQLRADRAPARDRLLDRCRRMLQRSPAAYVLVVEAETMTVIPAVAVLAGTDLPAEPRDAYYYKSVGPFLIEFFAAFLGDRSLSAGPDGLAAAVTEHGVESGLAISIGPEQAGLSDFL